VLLADEQEGVVGRDQEHGADCDLPPLGPGTRPPSIDGDRGVAEHHDTGDVVAQRGEQDRRDI